MVWALLPVKDLVRAKSRLAGVLAPHERRALAQAMVEDVLAALGAVVELEGVLLLSDDPTAELLAYKYAIEVISETSLGCTGLNNVVNAGRQLLEDRGVRDLLVVHGDIPLLQAADVQRVINLYREPATDLVIVPDTAGDGTNLMLFAVNKAPAFCYGPGSCAAHRASATERGLACAILQHPGMGLDVDEPADLLQLYHCLRGGARGEHSARLLLSTEVAQRLSVLEPSLYGATGQGQGQHDAI